MPWKKGKIKFDDGTTYPAELLVKENGQVWNVRVYKDGKVIEEINTQKFAKELNKNVENIYPYTYELEE